MPTCVGLSHLSFLCWHPTGVLATSDHLGRGEREIKIVASRKEGPTNSGTLAGLVCKGLRRNTWLRQELGAAQWLGTAGTLLLLLHQYRLRQCGGQAVLHHLVRWCASYYILKNGFIGYLFLLMFC